VRAPKGVVVTRVAHRDERRAVETWLYLLARTATTTPATPPPAPEPPGAPGGS